MTSYETASLIITAFGFAGAIVSLVFLILQTRAATESVKLTVREAIAARTMEIHRLFLDNPELRPYFYDNRRCPPEDGDFPRVQQMAELLCDFYDSLLMQHRLYPGAWEATRWKRYIEDILTGSQVLREYLGRPEVREWYRRDRVSARRPDLVQMLEAVQARAEASPRAPAIPQIWGPR